MSRKLFSVSFRNKYLPLIRLTEFTPCLHKFNVLICTCLEITYLSCIVPICVTEKHRFSRRRDESDEIRFRRAYQSICQVSRSENCRFTEKRKMGSILKKGGFSLERIRLVLQDSAPVTDVFFTEKIKVEIILECGFTIIPKNIFKIFPFG